jgi:hypothetical protein
MKSLLEPKLKAASAVVQTYDFSNKRAYANWLAQTYYFVRHSTPMLALSAGHSVNNREYHNRCITHLSEEKGHDKMILNDLKQLGYSINEFPELVSTQALYQSQYYWIQHKGPTSFLGYIAFLEGLSIFCGPTVLKKSTGLAGKTFLKLHAEEDVDHLDKAYAIVASLPEAEQMLAIQNFELSAHLYLGMISELAALESTPALSA